MSIWDMLILIPISALTIGAVIYFADEGKFAILSVFIWTLSTFTMVVAALVIIFSENAPIAEIIYFLANIFTIAFSLIFVIVPQTIVKIRRKYF